MLLVCLYLVSTCGDVRSQSLHLTLEDVVFFHLILHRWQVLAKALSVQVVLKRGTKHNTLCNPAIRKHQSVKRQLF